jgi:hypothetical protein
MSRISYDETGGSLRSIAMYEPSYWLLERLGLITSLHCREPLNVLQLDHFPFLQTLSLSRLKDAKVFGKLPVTLRSLTIGDYDWHKIEPKTLSLAMARLTKLTSFSTQATSNFSLEFGHLDRSVTH